MVVRRPMGSAAVRVGEHESKTESREKTSRTAPLDFKECGTQKQPQLQIENEVKAVPPAEVPSRGDDAGRRGGLFLRV